MTLSEEFEKETGLEYYEYLEEIGNLVPIEYVKWLEAKINYTRCSTQLKDKEVPNFDEWLRNFKKTEDDCYWLNKEVLYCKEAMKLHYDNLPDE